MTEVLKGTPPREIRLRNAKMHICGDALYAERGQTLFLALDVRFHTRLTSYVVIDERGTLTNDRAIAIPARIQHIDDVRNLVADLVPATDTEEPASTQPAGPAPGITLLLVVVFASAGIVADRRIERLRR